MAAVAVIGLIFIADSGSAAAAVLSFGATKWRWIVGCKGAESLLLLLLLLLAKHRSTAAVVRRQSILPPPAFSEHESIDDGAKEGAPPSLLLLFLEQTFSAFSSCKLEHHFCRGVEGGEEGEPMAETWALGEGIIGGGGGEDSEDDTHNLVNEKKSKRWW